MNSVRKPVVFTCLEILSHFLASVVQCQLHWHITTSSSVNCLENFKYNRTWRLSCYIVQHFWARTSTSLWNNRKQKQSLTISSLQCAVRGSCPHVENVQESANWKFWKPFRKKWLYTYIHAWCVCLYSLYKEFCLFPGLTHQLSQSWHWQQTSVVVLTLRWEVLALPCLLNSIPSFLFAWLWEKRHGKRSLHCYRSWWAFPHVHLEVLYSYQCSEINIFSVSVFLFIQISLMAQSDFRVGVGCFIELDQVTYTFWDMEESSCGTSEKSGWCHSCQMIRQILSSFCWQNIVGYIGRNGPAELPF